MINKIHLPYISPYMRKFLLLIVSVGLFTFAEAQLKFGVKGGVNGSTFTGPDVDTAKIKFGFNAGVFGEFAITDALALRPEIMYSRQGGKGTKNAIVATSSTNYLLIPVLINWVSPSGGFFVETGPQIGFLMSGNIKAAGFTVDAKNYYKKNDFSWVYGFGYHFTDNIGVNARYNMGLSNVSDVTGQKAKSHVFQLGVFYTFDLPGMASK
jgi:opacity protein-like surface antigen